MLSFSSWVWRPSRLHQVRAVACVPPSPRTASRRQPRPSFGWRPAAPSRCLCARCPALPPPQLAARPGVKAAAFPPCPSQHLAGTLCALRSSRLSYCSHCQVTVFCSGFFLVRQLSGYPEPPTPTPAVVAASRRRAVSAPVYRSAGTRLPFLSRLFSLPLTWDLLFPKSLVIRWHTLQ